MVESLEAEWYVLQTYSGYENKVKTSLESRIETMNMVDFIYRVIVPEQEVIDRDKDGAPIRDKEGEIKTHMENEYPGYVLVKMVMTDEAWYVVRNTPNVTGFLGSRGGGAKPVSLTPDEVDTFLHRYDQDGNPIVDEPEVKRADLKLDANIGDTVKIISGSMAGQEGPITAIDNDKAEVTVLITFFGRETPTQASFADVETITY
ncbi:transcription termination/antitermination factor NusG [Weissella diestrammenae]|uniref:Transcription termination/antitermination protein NusG n=1 Tax=Weissella diestrammenae TaxID=1162633 RepID=A0A7G9T6Z0_9LACO|nr:transcription termination/antitermination protein NusG [Weissella diestrammenae]MCM0582538.1 transcription termination/antitermination factor NusG [Weissella diestrammenae]QNN75865.1 transcription termination/antitermination factor NusG [Weissella diestrammenae]